MLLFLHLFIVFIKISSFDKVNESIKVMTTLKYPNISDQLYKILNVRGSKLWKPNDENDIDKLHFCKKDPFKQNHLINKKKNFCLIHFDNPSARIEHWNTSSNIW